MTKGKLYEEIKKNFLKEFSGAGELWFNYFGTPEENAEEVTPYWTDLEIDVVLDEAKKEFPADAHGLDVEKVMPWFWKYFGDEE